MKTHLRRISARKRRLGVTQKERKRGLGVTQKEKKERERN
jgi:hypothetical protein